MRLLAIDPGNVESAWIQGVLCKRGHDNGNGYSWRYKSGHCILCQKAVHARSKIKRRHKDKALAKIWRHNNRERLAKKQREYRIQHPDRVALSESRRTRTPEQRAAFNAYRRRYAKENPDKQQASYQKRRAALSINNTLTAEEIAQQRQLQNGLCFYCKKPLDNEGRGHIDHKTPLCRGGFNEASNIAIACSPCNLSKARKTAEEFLSK